MRNGMDSKHSFDNVHICLCWQMQSIFSLKKKKKKYNPVEKVLMWVISFVWNYGFLLGIIYQDTVGRGGGGEVDLTSGCDKMTQTCLNCPQMNRDGRHVLCKWLQLAWTEQANCCHLDSSLVVQLEKHGSRTRALQNAAHECPCTWVCVCSYV